MKSVTVKASKTYEVKIERGLLQTAGEDLKKLFPAMKLPQYDEIWFEGEATRIGDALAAEIES